LIDSVRVGIVAGLFLAAGNQSAQAAECVTDVPPACVEGRGYFDNKEAEQTCRNAVKAYQQSVNAFWDCQREQANAVDDEARKVIRLFNCRARGKETCE